MKWPWLMVVTALGAVLTQSVVAGPEETPRPVPPKPDENQTVVNIRANGQIVIHAREISEEDFRVRMAALAKLNPRYCIIVRGDENTPYQQITRVLELCLKAGLQDIALPAPKPE